MATDKLTAATLVEKHWPFVREVYISPLSDAGDVIRKWQVEVMMTGGKTEAWVGETEKAALMTADEALIAHK